MYDATQSRNAGLTQGATPAMVYTCPHCQGRFDFNTETAPRQIFCPLCGKSFDPVKLETMKYAEGTPPVPSPVEGRTVPQPEKEERLNSGQRLGQFRIDQFIGRGGMGAVYRATQTSLDRTVALKVLPKHMAEDPEFVQRFHREAKALAELNHPNIVSIYDKGNEDGQYFFAMEFVDGVSLRQLMKSGKLSPPEALKLVPQICEALEYAHSRGVIHRDIKPENILVDRSGRLKIADFGLARIVRGDSGTTFDGLTRSDVMMGTVNYMAPEQRENAKDVDHRADIYSLGVVIYEMLTGELPIGRFAAPSKKVQVDVRIDDVVLQLLEKDPQARYQRVSDVRTSIEQVLSDRPAPVCWPSSSGGAPDGSRRGRKAAGVVLAVFGLIVLGTMLMQAGPSGGSEVSVPALGGEILGVLLLLSGAIAFVSSARPKPRRAIAPPRGTPSKAGQIAALLVGSGLFIGATVWAAIHLATDIDHPWRLVRSVDGKAMLVDLSGQRIYPSQSEADYWFGRHQNVYGVLALACLGLVSLSPLLRARRGNAVAWTTAIVSLVLGAAAAAGVWFAPIYHQDWLARIISTATLPAMLAFFGVAWVAAKKAEGPFSEVPPSEAPTDRWAVRLFQMSCLIWIAGAAIGLFGDYTARLVGGIVTTSLGGLVALAALWAVPRIGGAEDGRDGLRYALFAALAAAVWPVAWIAGDYSWLGKIEFWTWTSAWLFVGVALLDLFLRPWNRFGRYFGLGARLERRAWAAVILGSAFAGLLACEFDYREVNAGSNWVVATLPFVGTIAYTFLVIWGVPLSRTASAPCPIGDRPVSIQANCPSGAGINISLGTSAPPIPSIPQTPIPVAVAVPSAEEIQAEVRASLAASGIPMTPDQEVQALKARKKLAKEWRGLISHAGTFGIIFAAFTVLGWEARWMAFWGIALFIHVGSVVSKTALPVDKQALKTRAGKLRKEAHDFLQHLGVFVAVMGGLSFACGHFPSWGWFWAIGLAFHAMGFFLDLAFGKEKP